jgi:hypothetical protein
MLTKIAATGADCHEPRDLSATGKGVGREEAPDGRLGMTTFLFACTPERPAFGNPESPTGVQ